ncbi:MAG: lipoyl synthase [Calditrichaeota bacterium]|nr:MAG: lipoyl synthase [Calditrichota bacterium]
MTNKRRPEWLKVRLSRNRAYHEVRELIESLELHTVCKSARCPNMGECWSRRTATFMILGDICTRNCRFCAVSKGIPQPPDPSEPERLADAVLRLGLRHVVITSVTRDDLPDGGSEFFVQSVNSIRKKSSGCSVELLIPDFHQNLQALDEVFDAEPDILNHNLEVVPRLYSDVRPAADFEWSLEILARTKKNKLISKTGIMIGLGESWEEIMILMHQLAEIQLDILTIGQYLQPTQKHTSVIKYYHPDEFLKLKKTGEALGINHVESGPLVRSSYHADEQIACLHSLSH